MEVDTLIWRVCIHKDMCMLQTNTSLCVTASPMHRNALQIKVQNVIAGKMMMAKLIYIRRRTTQSDKMEKKNCVKNV